MATARRSLRQLLSGIRRSRSSHSPLEETRGQTRRPDQTSWRRTVIEVSPLVLGIVFAVIYFGQWRAMKGQLGVMQDQAYVSCLSAQLSRNLLIETRTTATDAHNAMLATAYQAIAAVQSQEASVDFTVGNTDVIPGRFIAVPFEMTNNGNSYAIGARYRIRAEFLPRDSDPDFTYPKDSATIGYANRLPKVIGPAPPNHRVVVVKGTHGNPIIATLADAMAYRTSEKDVIIYGDITYKDTFGISHWLHACYVSQMMPAGRVKSTGHLKCEEYNKTDTNTVFPDTFSPSTPSPAPKEIVCTPPPDTSTK